MSSNPAYISNVTLGEKALLAEKYDSCLVYYADAFKIKQTSVLSTLRMTACAYSGGQEDVYEAQFAKAMEINWSTARALFQNYPEFKYLHGTDLETRVEKVYRDSAIAAGLDLELMAEFSEIAVTDQAQRQEMGPISDLYGWESPQMDSLWKIQSYSDSVNTARITHIIDSIGYPGKSLVSPQYMGTAFLVIQHADKDVQQKYLSIVIAAADAGEVRWSSVSLLVDRVNLGLDLPQIYGSQVSRNPETDEFFFFEIEQPYKVDSLRATIGMDSLTNYAQNWGFEYDPDKHVAKVKAAKAAAEKAAKEDDDKK